jgi:carbon-monoxide dehydrogenase catalytic subunit
MVARGLDRAIAAGTAAHSGHARHLAHTMLKMAEGKAKDYAVKDGAKLRAVATRMNIPVEGRSDNEIALDLAKAALADFGEKDTPVMWAATVVTKDRVKVLSDLGLVPKGIDYEVSEIMHRTLYGVDADAVNLLLAGLRCGVADLAGCYMGTDLADILFGTPTPVVTEANLGTLKADAVNIAVHGHNPVLSDLMRYSVLYPLCQPGNGYYDRSPRCHGGGLPVHNAVTGHCSRVHGNYNCYHHGYVQDHRRHPCRIFRGSRCRKSERSHRYCH